MDDHVFRLWQIAESEGVFLRREALDLGFDDKALRRALRRGELHRVRRGSYVPTPMWESDDDPARLLRLTRAVMRVGGPVAASHHSAAAAHDLLLWDVDWRVAHVTRTDGGSGRTERDACHHEGLWLNSELTTAARMPVVQPVRAAMESALLSGVERGLVTVDSGLHRGVFTREQLRAQHDLMRHWPGAQHLHVVTHLAHEGSESVGESRTKHLCWRQGLPSPQLQWKVYDGEQLVARTDFAWPEHGLLGEFDGKVKYGRALRPDEDPGDAVFREKKREDLIRRLTGWRVVRLVWADLYDPVRTAAMLRSMLLRAA